MSEEIVRRRDARTNGGRDGPPDLLGSGDHACLVYDDSGERVEVGVPFARSGLDAGERVVCVLGPAARDEFRSALAASGLDADTAAGAGALAFMDPAEYPPANGFEPSAMVETLEERVRRARDEGFGGVRILVDMAWVLEADLDGSDVLAYERLANECLFPKTGCTALCLYPRDAFGTDMLDGVVGAHPLTVVGGEAAPNPLYRLDQTSAGNGSPGTWERHGWIEPRLRRAAEAERILRELADADRRRDEFLAMLAHELRNPLAGISNAGAVLGERAASDPELRKVADVIDRQVGYLSVMLDDLLDLVRITHDEVELDAEEVHLEEIVAGAVATVEPWAEVRDVALELDLPDDDVLLRADRARMERALVKLVGNAVDHSDAGGVVAIEASVEGEDVVISVRDEGPGIEANLLPRIFEPFVRSEGARYGGRPGLGVGLAIVKHAVELHGGRVEARSEGAGTGAEFTIRAPLGVAAAPGGGATVSEPSARSESTRATRILVVDDDRDSVGLLRDLFEVWGHQIEVAYDGEEAVERAGATSPDIVFLDLGLPKLDGLEVARRIRERSAPEGPILVAMTGYGRPQDMERTREAGFEQHLVKPISVETVRELLDRYG